MEDCKVKGVNRTFHFYIIKDYIFLYSDRSRFMFQDTLICFGERDHSAAESIRNNIKNIFINW